MTLGKRAPHRRALTGTPVANSPEDVYTLMRWLYPTFWEPYGIRQFQAFRTQFCLFEDLWLGARKIQKVVGYQRLPELHQIISQASTHISKDVPGAAAGVRRHPVEERPRDRRA
jgi:SNF2-related domain